MDNLDRENSKASHPSSNCENNDLAPSLIFLHAAVRFDNFVQVKNLADLHVHRAFLNLFDQIIERCFVKFLRPAVVSCQADRASVLSY